MSNTTDTYWEVNGVSLQTYAFNITTWGGDLQAPPPLRGEDQKIPFRPGVLLQPRIPDSMTRTFNMWVIGADEDGNIVPSRRAEFERNYKKIRALFWNGGEPVTIKKRWRDYGSSVIREAVGTAIFADGLAPAMQGSQRATFSVAMFFADPFFYGDEETIPFNAVATATTTATILGDYETTDISLEFSGARNNMRLTNVTRGIWLNVQRDLASGSKIVVDVDDWTAVQNPTGTPVNVIRYVTHFGHKFWMSLKPGSQQLRISSTSGAGAATLKYRPRWI